MVRWNRIPIDPEVIGQYGSLVIFCSACFGKHTTCYERRERANKSEKADLRQNRWASDLVPYENTDKSEVPNLMFIPFHLQ